MLFCCCSHSGETARFLTQPTAWGKGGWGCDVAYHCPDKGKYSIKERIWNIDEGPTRSLQLCSLATMRCFIILGCNWAAGQRERPSGQFVRASSYTPSPTVDLLWCLTHWNQSIGENLLSDLALIRPQIYPSNSISTGTDSSTISRLCPHPPHENCVLLLLIL